MTVTSGYRCETHNSDPKVRGAKNSQHIKGVAADIVVKGMTPREVEAAAKMIPAFRDGGIGRNDFQEFVHVDVRGQTARWCYNEDRKEVKYYA